MTLRARLLRGVYTEHFDFLSTGSANVFAMTNGMLCSARRNRMNSLFIRWYPSTCCWEPYSLSSYPNSFSMLAKTNLFIHFFLRFLNLLVFSCLFFSRDVSASFSL